MLTIKPLQDLSRIKQILIDPELFILSNGHGLDPTQFEPPAGVSYLEILNEAEETIGLFSIREMTKLCIEGHIAILPAYWGTGLPQQAMEVGFDYASSLGYTKIFTMVPSVCIHVLKFLQKLKFHTCGSIEKSYIYNNHLTTLFLFEKDLTTR